MPLRRGQILRYDADRMAFEFTLLDSEGGTVRCQIAATPASINVARLGVSVSPPVVPERRGDFQPAGL
jgi:hypothetical protein